MGKLAVQERLNAVAPGAVVHIQDQLTKQRFLVDTGASFSIFPHYSSAPASGPVLSGRSGNTIPCWGEKKLTLSFHGKVFTWTFLLPAVQFPILGVDFLQHYILLVDPATNRLVDTFCRETFATVPSHAVSTAAPRIFAFHGRRWQPVYCFSLPGSAVRHLRPGACTPARAGNTLPFQPAGYHLRQDDSPPSGGAQRKSTPGLLGAALQVATCGHPPGVADLLIRFTAVVNKEKPVDNQ